MQFRTPRLTLAAFIGFTLATHVLAADALPFVDPAPPKVAAVATESAATPQPNANATFHAPPKPLARDAVREDWPCYLGPHHNNVSDETHLLAKFPKAGPALVWEMNRGSGYSAPAILGEHLVLLHRIADEEMLDCLKPDTGQRYWRYTYRSEYMDRYGYCDGPRASPVIWPGKHADGSDARVVSIGAEGKLHCLLLSTGQLLWTRDLLREFKQKQNYFGVGSTPLIEGERLIINVGAPAGPCVAAFDILTGRMLWGASSGESAWGPSYASPIPAFVRGHRRILVFAGGETGSHEPVTGGLLCLDPADGHVDFTFPWRGTRRESVNASSPLIIGKDGEQVLVSECYGSGGALVNIDAEFKVKSVWTNENFGTHFMTAVEKDGYFYGVDGHGPDDAFLVCVERATGKEVWRKQPEWEETEIDPETGAARQSPAGIYRCQLMPADGRCLCLGEYGHLLWLDLEPTGYKELDRVRLFGAPETWTGPVLSGGLLYINQNTRDAKHGPRLLCYDLRAE